MRLLIEDAAWPGQVKDYILPHTLYTLPELSGPVKIKRHSVPTLEMQSDRDTWTGTKGQVYETYFGYVPPTIPESGSHNQSG